MSDKYPILIALLLFSVSISGCMGDDGEERIDQLEAEAINYQEMVESLNQTLDALEGRHGTPERLHRGPQLQDNGLDGEILQHISEIAYLSEQNSSKMDEITHLSGPHSSPQRIQVKAGVRSGGTGNSKIILGLPRYPPLRPP